MINRPLKHKEPHTYKDICKKKYSTVPNHDGSVPGEKQSIFIDTHSDKTFKINGFYALSNQAFFSHIIQ